MEFKTTKLKSKPICPKCNKTLDGAAGTGEPKEGDVSICIGCAVPLRYDENMLLRRMTKKEFKEFPAFFVAEMKAAQKNVLRLIKARKADASGI